MSGNGKIAIVTGAGSGIGRASAIALLQDGWTVTLAGRRQDPLEETASLAGADGARTLVVPTDVGDEDAMRNLFDATKEAFGRLDFLFNNAGMGVPPADPDDIAFADWKKVVDANLHGSFLGIQNAFRLMRAQDPKGGRIVNNGSISSYTPRPGSIPYTSTKHAVTGLTKTASLDGRKHDIAVGQLDVGNASTPMTDRMSKGVPQANGDTMIEPTMDVDNVARAIVYMASLPLDANVQFMTVMATKMPYVGRG
ncbi:MAG: SDR family oxidoreductase [Pseudomonadota bacterium]|nr:SDR family oxidoreductase [Pseudomonadota bacterium]MEC7574163.1 SDR family oxidoreductase [Pseudomonadota bacterium]MEC7647535.1 SDR family oxidoreductase [Pseudomonadota bacterium]MEC8698619.1 SDR family oxidoreductase [Pseudomonadota bacterium]MEC9184720.1 SDR family oxidoreductase [Pseudomonadota bacterium]